MKNNLSPSDPFSYMRTPNKHKGIFTPEEDKANNRKHEEADLHLMFCKWVKLQHPNDQFVRHEREGKRSFFMQNLFKVYNSDLDKLPDFECLEPQESVYSNWSDGTLWYHRLYIEFKKPRTKLTLKDNITIKPEYSEQYKRHVRFWEQNSPAYFCDSLDYAIELYTAYKSGKPLPMQIFTPPTQIK